MKKTTSVPTSVTVTNLFAPTDISTTLYSGHQDFTRTACIRDYSMGLSGESSSNDGDMAGIAWDSLYKQGFAGAYSNVSHSFPLLFF